MEVKKNAILFIHFIQLHLFSAVLDQQYVSAKIHLSLDFKELQ